MPPARYQYNNSGQILIEFLVALGVFVVVIGAVMSISINGSIAQRDIAKAVDGYEYLDEGMRAIWSIQRRSWVALPLGTYGLSDATGVWELTLESDQRGSYERTVTIDWTQRDAQGEITNTGNRDIWSKTATVSIVNRNSGAVFATTKTVYASPESKAWTENLVADFNDGTFQNTRTTDQDGGEVQLMASSEAADSFPFVLSSTSGQQLRAQTQKLAFRFTAANDMTITAINVNAQRIRGNSPTYRVGIQSSSETHAPTGTWLGQASLGYGLIDPAATGWASITLQQPVVIPSGTEAHIVIEWSSGQINANNSAYWLVSSPTNFIRPFDGSPHLESRVLTASSGSNWAEQNLEPIYIFRTSSGFAMGNPYTASQVKNIFGTSESGQQYAVGNSPIQLTGVGFWLRRRSSQQPQGPCTLTIRDLTANAILTTQILATPQQTTTSYAWRSATLLTPITLPASHQIRFELSSSSTTSARAYQTVTYDASLLQEYLSLSFQGEQGFSETKNTTTWLSEPGRDMPIVLSSVASPIDNGTYVSSVFDTQNDSVRYSAIGWKGDLPAGTSIEIHVRTGTTADECAGASWIGPDGTSNTSFADASEVPQSITQGRRFIQYRITLHGNGATSPSLNSITILYE